MESVNLLEYPHANLAGERELLLFFGKMHLHAVPTVGYGNIYRDSVSWMGLIPKDKY